jgi:AbrB family looped-hinge helix DNA binding protein
MVARIKVSSKNQISIPAEARKKLKIKPGDTLLFDIRDGSATLMREPENYAEHLHGLGREVWEGVDVQEYIRQERGRCARG